MEVIGRCGGDEKNELCRTDKSRTLKTNKNKKLFNNEYTVNMTIDYNSILEMKPSPLFSAFRSRVFATYTATSTNISIRYYISHY